MSYSSEMANTQFTQSLHPPLSFLTMEDFAQILLEFILALPAPILSASVQTSLTDQSLCYYHMWRFALSIPMADMTK